MKNALLILVVLFGTTAMGQYKDLIQLKNGSSVRGRVIEKNEQQVKIRTRDGSILVFNAADVIGIDDFRPEVSSSGYYLDAGMGLLGGPGRGSFSGQLVQGYAFSRHWQAGVGLGFETAAFNSYVPVFAEGKFNWLNKATSPFVKLMGGYMVPMNFTQSNGGFTLGAALGYTIYLSHRLGLTTSLGYRFARLVERNNWWWDEFETIRQLNRFEVRFGLTFR